MVSFKNILFFSSVAAAAAAATLQRRATIADVQKDVTAIDTHVKSLIRATSAYEGGYLAASPLLGDLAAVYGSLSSGVLDSSLLPATTMSESDAFAFINHVNQTLAIDNPLAVKTLESKKSYFQEAGLDGNIVTALELLKTGHDSFSANVVERLPADALAPAKEVIGVIDAALQDGINSFSSSS